MNRNQAAALARDLSVTDFYKRTDFVSGFVSKEGCAQVGPPQRVARLTVIRCMLVERSVIMNRMAVVVLALAGVLAAFVPPAHAQNVTCTQAGTRTVCSNGQTFFQQGNQTFDTQGHVWTNLGNQTLGSQGDLYTRNGNQVFDNRGNAWDVINGQQVGPDGKKCAQVGTQVFCGR